MRDAFFNEISKLFVKYDNAFFVTGDLGFGVLQPLESVARERIINCGIAEQSMTSFAAGLGQNSLVFTYSIGNFSTLRCLEQIRNDVCYMNSNVKIVSMGSGYSYGSLGVSHHATEDIAIMRSLPNMTVFSPSDQYECRAIVNYLFLNEGPVYLRLDRNGQDVHKTEIEYSLVTTPLIVRHCDEAEIAVFSTGSITVEVIKAVDRLISKGVKCDLFSVPCIKPLTFQSSLLSGVKKVITVEEHTIMGGFGSAISEHLLLLGLNVNTLHLGISDLFCSLVGDQNYLRKAVGLDSESLEKRISDFVYE